ncbi:enoyl-CoA hydratase-related protein [Angustibacter luteus]|uniref:Enoyl-CoA hydratase-related protein n=1 Tax=Angustibacter luteus TaxID=658456 RepID=A0ABW1JDP0_9ACTN
MTPPESVGIVGTEIRDGIGWVTLDNPTRRNAISTSMMATLGSTLRALDDDPTIRVIVLRGRGTDAFAAGADISEFETHQTKQASRQENEEAVGTLFGTLSELTTPLIVMVHGYCIGAGMALALAADLRISSPTGRFAIPAARLGIGYPVTLTHALVDAVGPGHASDMLFTGRTLTAEEAQSIGLINRVVDSASLEAHVLEVASQIAANAPLSVRAAKTSIKARTNSTLAERAERHVAACLDSEDAREGQRAFMERRDPTFEGR